MMQENTGAGKNAAFIFNTTYQVAWPLHELWLNWLLDELVPAVLGTGCFIKHQVVRLLETDETDGPVYAVQYYLSNMALFNEYNTLYREGFAQREAERWNGQVFSFSSLMQVVN
ncbi:MAG TPA: DUF4286 family protein [Chitinophagaceae bacterium]|nr:DUF4286 family protein [Chitinophagaceae bacterium]